MEKYRGSLSDLIKTGQAAGWPHNILGLLRHGQATIFYDEKTSSVWLNKGYFNYLAGDKEVLLAHFESLDDGFYGFSGVSGDIAEAFLNKGLIQWIEHTERYEQVVPLNMDLDSGFKVRSVKLEDAPGIDNRYEYQGETSLSEIQEAILKRPSAGVYHDNRLVSYCLQHDDGSIGYMYTLEEFRHQGLAYVVAQDIFNQVKAQGQVPFVEIRKTNRASQALAAKTNLVKTAYTPWFGLVKGRPDEIFELCKRHGDLTCMTSLDMVRHFLEKTSEELVFDADIVDSGHNMTITIPSGQVRFTRLDDQVYQVESDHGLTTDDLLAVIAYVYPHRYGEFWFTSTKGFDEACMPLFLCR